MSAAAAALIWGREDAAGDLSFDPIGELKGRLAA
jgi:hypothetical protein